MKKGEFLLINYVGRVAETGEIFDLTDEAVARKEKVFVQDHRYAPAPVIIGAGMIIRGVENRLERMHTGKEERFTVPPEEAFGRRDPKMIRIISMAHFIRQKITPTPGAYVTVDSLRARIQSVSGGRVRIDFNDPLAGKQLNYAVRIVKVIKDPGEKMRLLFQRYGIKADVSFNPQTREAEARTETPLKDAVQKVLQGMVRKWIPEVKALAFTAGAAKQREETSKGHGDAEKPRDPPKTVSPSE
jgi:FKBP-type peptidyl-prolyl cis-trans isomerase 2